MLEVDKLKQEALQCLRTAVGSPTAQFKEGQWEAIEEVLNNKKVLVVQKTGWGKSMVYFLATKILREKKKFGPTILISPLISLMNNQIKAAKKLGLKSVSYNSTNTTNWRSFDDLLNKDAVDLILVTPEHFTNTDKIHNEFEKALEKGRNLIVVDEAHCISEWGHDFRLDYRRIVEHVRNLPPNIPILATTATATQTVINDIREQIGENLVIHKGDLSRPNIALQNIRIPDVFEKMAWVLEYIRKQKGSGLIYVLTKAMGRELNDWLCYNGIKSGFYHGEKSYQERLCLEEQILSNELKVLVATSALSMGFDKPDLSFVIHYQKAQSILHYYQEIGRVGRNGSPSQATLLWGDNRDDKTIEFFIKDAFPNENLLYQILDVLEYYHVRKCGEIRNAIQSKFGCQYRTDAVLKALEFLEKQKNPPLHQYKSIKSGVKCPKWELVPQAERYEFDSAHANKVREHKREEMARFQRYVEHDGCLMSFLRNNLEDYTDETCGLCQHCRPELRLSEEYDQEIAEEARTFLRNRHIPFFPKTQDPTGEDIPDNLQAEKGLALSFWKDNGWGELVYKGKYEENPPSFSEELVVAFVLMYEEWMSDIWKKKRPQWVTNIPSRHGSTLVKDFAQEVAKRLGLQYIECFQLKRGL